MNFEGLFPALVTPFDIDYRIDNESLERLVKRLIETKGVAGLVCNANAGEIWSLSEKEQVSLIKTVRSYVGTNFPVISGLIGTSLTETSNRLDSFQKAGADAVLVFPLPEWFVGIDPDVPVRYFKALGAETTIPLIVFQYPAKAGAAYSADILKELVTIPQIAAIKEAVWDINRFSKEVHVIRSTNPKVKILSGIDEFIFESLCIGADGMLLAAGCLIPSQLVGLFGAIKRGDLEEARLVADNLAAILHELYGVRPFARRHARLKWCLNYLGVLKTHAVRFPSISVEDNGNRLRKCLHEIGLTPY